MMRRIRCAIYTRKSSEDGLEQDFNSLDAQREACEAYIASQKHEGWELIPKHYDDGGISGGHLDRPALQELMQAVDNKQIDQIVVYKIDRLTRSLADFAKLVDRLDLAKTSFVSVTQSFNTATSMGRLTLNMLLSFAQFEREVTAERIRDKISASKRKGMWMGGNVPLGYQADRRTLKVDQLEAITIKQLYNLYLKHQTVFEVKEQAVRLNLRSRLRTKTDGSTSGGKHFDQGHIHHILSNPVYAGKIRHKGTVYEGQHDAIIETDIWHEVQTLLVGKASTKRGTRNKASKSPLINKLYDETGDSLSPTHTCKNGKRLRYYVSRRLIREKGQKNLDGLRLPAEQIEQLLAEQVASHLAQIDTATSILLSASAVEIQNIRGRFGQPQARADYLGFIDHVKLRPDELTVQLSQDIMAKFLDCESNRLNRVTLEFVSPVQMRRRGVELKLHIGDAPNDVDHILIRNIVTAREYLSMILAGRTFDDIAKAAQTSKRRVQNLVDLALLSPDTMDAIVQGKQPTHLTTDYLIKTGFSANWFEQREQFAAL